MARCRGGSRPIDDYRHLANPLQRHRPFPDGINVAEESSKHSSKHSVEQSLERTQLQIQDSLSSNELRESSRKEVGAPDAVVQIGNVGVSLGSEIDPEFYPPPGSWSLHAIEDQEVPSELIAREFGTRVAALVEEVTDDKSLDKPERKRLQVEHASKKSDAAKIIELADKTSNVRAIAFAPSPEWSVKRRLEYIDWAKRVVQGLRAVCPWLED